MYKPNTGTTDLPKNFLTRATARVSARCFGAPAWGDDDDDTTAPAETTAAAGDVTTAPADATTAPADAPTTAATAPPETTTTEPSAALAAGLWDDGPCDESLDTVKLGLITVFESGVLTLIDQAQAAEASAEAFNSRGGLNGRCIEMITCDDKADPNQAVQCARDLVDEGIVATINDTTSFGAADVIAVLTEASIPRFAISPGIPELQDPLSYGIDAGGIGTSIMMVPPLLDAGHTKIAIVRVDAAAATALKGLYEGSFADEGAEFVADLPVAAGTTDYSQFVLAAEAAGATGVVMPVGGQEGIQILEAAKELDSDLEFSGSLGSFPYSDIASLGDYASHLTLNAAIPPATNDNPAVQLIIEDLAPSGIEALQVENLKSSPMRSWVGLYAFLSIMRDANPDEITAATVTEAVLAAKDIDMLGLIPPWTPAKTSPGVFTRISNGVYGFWSWDPEAEYNGTPGNFVQVGDGDIVEVFSTSNFK